MLCHRDSLDRQCYQTASTLHSWGKCWLADDSSSVLNDATSHVRELLKAIRLNLSVIAHSSTQHAGHLNNSFETYPTYFSNNGTHPNHGGGGEHFLITLQHPWPRSAVMSVMQTLPALMCPSCDRRCDRRTGCRGATHFHHPRCGRCWGWLGFELKAGIFCVFVTTLIRS